MSESPAVCDTLIIGAGVVGLALARELSMRGRDVLVLEAEAAIGLHASSRNSEVIHAGIYYAPGSLKARLCVHGRALLYAYCEQRGIEARRLGKLIVASGDDELATLHDLKARAEQNGVHDLSLLSARELQALEPAVSASAALFSPSTGIIDSHAFLQSLKADATAHGAVIQLATRFESALPTSSGFEVHYAGRERGTLRCARLINAAGLFAPQVARAISGLASDKLPHAHYAKGHYFSLRGPSPFSRLVYPVPAAHGLGVHLTLDLAGRARFGPDVSFIDTVDYGFDETRRERFARAIRRYFPALDSENLEPSYTGIRPKLGPEGAAASDFVVEDVSDHGLLGLVNLFGIESPGLTASLALAEHVCALLEVRDAERD